MKFTYYYVNDYLTKAEIKKINKEFDKAPRPFHKQAPTVKSSVAVQTNYNKIKKIKDIRKSVGWINRKVFGFDIYENIDDDIIQNKYKASNRGQYKWHVDAEPYSQNFTLKLTTLINLSEKPYEGGVFKLFDGKPYHVKEFDQPGSMIVFPSYFLHKVTPVTKGERISCTIFETGPWWR